MTFRGSHLDTHALAAMIGAKTSNLGNKNEHFTRELGIINIQSYVTFSLNLPIDFRLSDMLPTLFEYMGGVAHISQVLTEVLLEGIEINFKLPARKEDEDSQDGYLPIELIEDISILKARVSFSFF